MYGVNIIAKRMWRTDLVAHVRCCEENRAQVSLLGIGPYSAATERTAEHFKMETK
jgi:hypothetical protein